MLQVSAEVSVVAVLAGGGVAAGSVGAPVDGTVVEGVVTVDDDVVSVEAVSAGSLGEHAISASPASSVREVFFMALETSPHQAAFKRGTPPRGSPSEM
jgi:hypothetical protein